MLIEIDTDGTMKFIARDELQGLLTEGTASKARASHVLPCLPPSRLMFRFLRWATGETGLVSDWTRRWPWYVSWCWSVEIVNGPQLGTYWDRAEAIAAEIEYLERTGL